MKCSYTELQPVPSGEIYLPNSPMDQSIGLLSGNQALPLLVRLYLAQDTGFQSA